MGRTRFWLVWVLLALGVAAAVYVLSGSFNAPEVATVSGPTRIVSPTATPSASAAPSTRSAVAPTSTPSPTPKQVVPPPIVIPGSRPVELYFPAFGVHILMDSAPCPVDSAGLYEPSQQTPQNACYIKDAQHPFVFPATNAADLSVILGHTWQQGNAAFNLLYDWRAQHFSVKAGDELEVRTEASGARWLVYKAVQFYTPEKTGPNGLQHDTAVWGTAPEPNTLVTVGCLQPPQVGVETTQNVVIKWALTGVS